MIHKRCGIVRVRPRADVTSAQTARPPSFRISRAVSLCAIFPRSVIPYALGKFNYVSGHVSALNSFSDLDNLSEFRSNAVVIYCSIEYVIMIDIALRLVPNPDCGLGCDSRPICSCWMTL
ncbi:hypothetical protein EVAR_11334_1 [Eumeta japonica]|uniref:Uncharacterized protein n=1 Tax=Eumeta variegata TaxID=151549 RepID=A0A4C1U1L4_EUMVA|nr:hypothetical protein EVAR_11334_1 [Eumeta japonica]